MESDNGSMQGLLPLFPLGVVLFPRTPLPLHIFEDRYKQLMADILPSGEFGVVLAQEKGILNVGCSASVDRVVEKYPDGQMDILTVGTRRFEILSLDQEKPYLRGEVEFFDDDEFTPVPKNLTEQALDGYRVLKTLQSSESVQEPALSDPQLSFQLAQLIPDVNFRQILLRSRSELERMRQLAQFLPGFLVRLRYIEGVRHTAPHNGHGRLQ